MPNKISDDDINKCETDYYDTVMSEPESVVVALCDALEDDDMREEVGSLIMQIVKLNGEHIQAKLKLVELIVKKCTDEVQENAERYAKDDARIGR